LLKPSPSISIAGRKIGDGHPVYIVAEIGINHQGDVEIAKRLISMAAEAGCDAVKFQKRDPETCVPRDQWAELKETRWGTLPYIEYRHRMEFTRAEYTEIDAFCKQEGITWFASAWDIPSLEFLESLDVPAHKVASACLTDEDLVEAMRALGKPVILSTGMSTATQIARAVRLWRQTEPLVITHCTSTYPCPPGELNLKVIPRLKRRYKCPVGYSGHEVGLQTTLAAVTLGACLVERHVTLDRTMWGSDQAASLEPAGLNRLVRDIRVIEQALGDGQKVVYDSELPQMKKLRRWT
jgi:sialic acid synthase SpsE|tara:strand:+ start:787 stop:1671 length:885 start_codon:yes stop_codon:yes gene_type:complete